MRRREQFDEFVANPLGADEFDFRRECPDGGKRLRFNFKIQLCGKPHRAQQTQMVFGEPFARQADGADDFRAQIFFTADPIVELFRGRIVEKSVHGEIAPLRIGLGVTERDLLRMAAIAIIRLGAKRGDLELMPAFEDDHHPELFADGDGAFEQFFDLFRPRGRGDVIIPRLASQQKIAHAAAHPERAEARALEMADDFNGRGTW